MMVLLNRQDITLRDFEKSDIENKVRWINDSRNNRFLHYDIPIEYDKTVKWFETKSETSRLDCVIEYKGAAVGLIGLLNIDYNNKKAEFYISMGEVAFKGRGIASEASGILIDYAFTALNIHKLYFTTDDGNEMARKMFERAGFQIEGVLRDDLIHRGQYIDRIRYFKINDREKPECTAR